MSNSAQQSGKESPRLTEATVQEIQLELIRRNEFNAFDGKQVTADLMDHREWWDAVLMDVLGLAGRRGIPGAGLIKLRDLPNNFWNVDTLYILATDEDSARWLTELGKKWLADSAIVYEEDTGRALGTSGVRGRRLVRMWWD